MWAPDALQEARESGEEGFERHCPLSTPELNHACLLGLGVCIALWCVFLLLCPFPEAQVALVLL